MALLPLRLAVLLTAALLAVPVLVIGAHLLVPAGEVWTHLAHTVLSEYITTSLLLMAGVAVGTLVLGVSTAWLTSLCQFPGRGLFEWALLLPMALPAYITAYTYTGLLDVSGPVQMALRDVTGLRYGQYWFPAVRSLPGAVVMLSLVLYPYVYLLTRAAFLGQSLCVLEVSRSLGNGPWRTFFKVAVPLARPAIAAGLSLALMETLADFGTVQYFGLNTFTTGIFRTWYGLDNAPAAANLAAILTGFALVLLVLETASRRRARFHAAGRRHQDLRRLPLRGWTAAAAVVACLLPLLLGFVVPAGQLAVWTAQVWSEEVDHRFIGLTGNTLVLAVLTAGLAVGLAVLLGYGRRLLRGAALAAAVRVAGLGYAVPGTVIALGVLIPMGWLDRTIDAWAQSQFGTGTGLLLGGTLTGLVFAYLVRFLAVALNGVNAGLERITPAMDEAGRALGSSPGRLLARVHLPMLRGSLLTAALLVFVDVLKELPATLILRPFNTNTLAVRAYEMASDERLANAGPAALMIVLAGVVPVIVLSRGITASRRVEKSQ